MKILSAGCTLKNLNQDFIESDNPSIHKIIVRNAALEKSMDNRAFERLIAEDDGMSVIMEFPENSPNNSNSVTQDVKEILRNILYEYFDKISKI